MLSTFARPAKLNSLAGHTSAAVSETVRSLSFCCHPHPYLLFTRRYKRTAMSPHKAPSREPDAAFTGQRQPQYNISEVAQGDLNNTASMRKVDKIIANPELAHLSLAIPVNEEHDTDTRAKYRPFLLEDAVAAGDWVARLELATATEMAQNDIAFTGQRLRILVLYGSLRNR